MIGENHVVRRGDPYVPILITCEHASNALPEGLDLGVPQELLESHWGWDRWADDVMRRFAPGLGATTVSARISRLVLDVNRGLEIAIIEDKHWGCRGSLVIDARVKPHHAPPLVEDPEITRRVDALAARGGPLAPYL